MEGYTASPVLNLFLWMNKQTALDQSMFTFCVLKIIRCPPIDATYLMGLIYHNSVAEGQVLLPVAHKGSTVKTI